MIEVRAAEMSKEEDKGEKHTATIQKSVRKTGSYHGISSYRDESQYMEDREQKNVYVLGNAGLVCRVGHREGHVHAWGEPGAGASHASSDSNARLQAASRHLFDIDKEQIG